MVTPVFLAAGMSKELQIVTATNPLCFKAQARPERESDEESKLSSDVSSQSPFIGRAERKHPIL